MKKSFYPNSRNLRKSDCLSLVLPCSSIVINFCDTLGYSCVLECTHGHITLSAHSVLMLMHEVRECFRKSLHYSQNGVMPELRFMINRKLPIYHD